MDDFIQILFRKKKFPIIIAKSWVITVAFFIAVDEFTKVIEGDIVLIIFALIVFFSIYSVYLIHEVKK